MEVAIAYVTRTDSPLDEIFDPPWGRIGVRSQPRLPGRLTFKAAKRTEATSLYAAPLYGPSLQYLGLLEPGYALAKDGPTRIRLTAEDADTAALVEAVETSLKKSPDFERIIQLDVPKVDGPSLDDLGRHGLHPAYYRTVPAPVKRAFLRKLFSLDQDGVNRRAMAALILATIGQIEVDEPETLRQCWYTGLLPDGRPFVLQDRMLQEQRTKWAVFQARQIQRTVIELFLRCFEMAIGAGARTLDAVLDHWRERSPTDLSRLLPGTVDDFFHAEIRPVSKVADWLTASRAWNATVHGGHKQYDDVVYDDEDTELLRALQMLARWWVRTVAWIEEQILPEWVDAGEGDRRLALGWFHRWVRSFLDRPVEVFLREVFSQLVFAQHIKVALMRFDGEIQRLRFTLGDNGMVPTAEVGDKLGAHPVRMADRLGTFIALLNDLGVVIWQDDGRIVSGPLTPESAARGLVGDSSP